MRYIEVTGPQLLYNPLGYLLPDPVTRVWVGMNQVLLYGHSAGFIVHHCS